MESAIEGKPRLGGRSPSGGSGAWNRCRAPKCVSETCTIRTCWRPCVIASTSPRSVRRCCQGARSGAVWRRRFGLKRNRVQAEGARPGHRVPHHPVLYHEPWEPLPSMFAVKHLEAVEPFFLASCRGRHPTHHRTPHTTTTPLPPAPLPHCRHTGHPSAHHAPNPSGRTHPRGKSTPSRPPLSGGLRPRQGRA
jgi:hypothetical protein